MPYWVEFENKSLNGTYVHNSDKFPEDNTDEVAYRYEGKTYYRIDQEKVKARLIAFCKEKFGVEPTSIWGLPYGSGRLLNPEHGVTAGGFFCFDPYNCKGRSSCPRSYACSE